MAKCRYDVTARNPPDQHVAPFREDRKAEATAKRVMSRLQFIGPRFAPDPKSQTVFLYQRRVNFRRPLSVQTGIRGGSSFAMSERPSGRYDVSVADVHLAPLRARVFYPTTNSSESALQAPWLAPSNEFPHEIVTNALRYVRVPFAQVVGVPLHGVASRTLPASYGAPLLSSQALSRLPVHIFSHGLGGATGGYNHVCMEIASHGGIVFAPEHSDGSAFLAKVDGERVQYARYNPLSHGASELEFRRNQLQTRVKDLEQTLRNIESVDRGDTVLQALEGAPKAPNLTGRLDVSNIHVSGHSFGGATALAFARSTKVNSVICLDAWLRSLTREIKDVDVGRAKLLFVDQGLSNMKESISARERLPRMSGGGTCDAVVIKGASHNNSSDFALRLPRWVALASGMTMRGSNPLQLLERQALVVKEFLNGDWRLFRERVIGGQVEGIGIAPLGRARYLGFSRESVQPKAELGEDVHAAE